MTDLIWTPACQTLLELALEEDLGRGDVTTEATIPRDRMAAGILLAKDKEAIVVAGLEVARRVFAAVSTEVVLTPRVRDGDAVATRTTLAEVRGPAWALLAGERTGLNFMQRLSGVATQARRYAEAAASGGGGARVVDTRKTTPGWRALEKWAVRVGGAHNHRPDLGGGVLIKDNHVAVAGGVGEAVRRARASAVHSLRVEVEVTTLLQIDEALAAGAEIILLDNMDDAEVARAVERVRRHPTKVLVEVSGGITLERIPRLSKLGVDLISSGALTHSARAVDISLDFEVK
ncbi:MAG: carboxylating nicotinate-nucleotide diphosphorylase [Deltaproteobacteria bacterium]|nr:carboxylating nicotinate-nucleotide diphosphorylase [Deltaproteobacteria bacterium]